MTNITNQDIASKLEQLKIQIDSQHLFLERWRCDISPIEEAHLETQRWAVAFAQGMLRTLAFMHGGALIALPALISMFAIDGTHILVAAAGVFGLGLVLVAYGNLECFKCVNYLTGHLGWKREESAIRAKAFDRPDLHPKEPTEKKIGEARDKKDADFKISQDAKQRGIKAAWFSIGCFVLGASLIIIQALLLNFK